QRRYVFGSGPVFPAVARFGAARGKPPAFHVHKQVWRSGGVDDEVHRLQRRIFEEGPLLLVDRHVRSTARPQIGLEGGIVVITAQRHSRSSIAADTLSLQSARRPFYRPGYCSPAARFDHHGRLTPPSIVSVLQVM